MKKRMDPVIVAVIWFGVVWGAYELLALGVRIWLDQQ